MTLEQTAPRAGYKRRRMEQASDGWASLPTDIVGLVTDRLLDSGQIVDYVVFRAVCSGWRASTPSPRDRDPAMHDPRLRPRGWIALCDGDAVRPDDTGEIILFHMRTAQRVRVRFPDLRDRRIISFSDGLVVLLHKTTGEIRVLNPFTRVAVDFPSVASVYPEAFKYRGAFLAMKGAVCSAASCSSSIAAVVWFPFPYSEVVVVADAGSDHWEILHPRFSVSNTLVFQGRLYATTDKAGSFEIVQLYPPTPKRPRVDLPVVVARVPDISRHRCYHLFLAESGGQMLVVLQRHGRRRAHSRRNSWKRSSFTLYEVDFNKNGGAKLTPASSLLDRVLFLSHYGCLSASAIDLPSLRSNSIYFSTNLSRQPVMMMHSLTTGLSEDLAAECQIHYDGEERIRSSVSPFTIMDHFLSFCHPKEWTKGLMFH